MKDFDTVLWPDTPFNLESSLVLVGRRGSEAHGTYIPSTDPNSIDDRDLMGIVIPPPEYLLGLKHWDHAESIKEVWDVVLYGFQKFVGLLVKQNPNVVGMLWLEPEDYLHISPIGQAIIDNRDLFRARHAAYESYVGYAYGQISKMERNECKGYMGAKRKALVEKYGFDCKNASHALRLLVGGEEYIRTGKMTVKRTVDRQMFIDVKTGKWSINQVKDYAAVKFASIKDALNCSALPEEIDREKINDLIVQLMLAGLKATNRFDWLAELKIETAC